MKIDKIKPIFLKPSLKSYIWGGTKLAQQWGKFGENSIAESWEISCREEGNSYDIATGKTLSETLKENPLFVGKNGDKFEFFPLLVKLIDAEDKLSIQVHPNDEYALKTEGQYGKTEIWYIVDAEPGAGVYCGFKSAITIEEVELLLSENRIIDALNFIEVNKGDTLFISAGTVHAICEGLVICEVQQNSSLTYRLYDYNRKDANGNGRELHINKSLQVIDSNAVTIPNATTREICDGVRELCDCKYFKAYEISGNYYKSYVDEKSFHGLVFLESAILIIGNDRHSVAKGASIFLPANMGEYVIEGTILVIKTCI